MLKFNYKLILTLMGLLLIINGGFMLLALPFSFYYGEGTWVNILTAGLITALSGVLLRVIFFRAENKNINKRDGYLIVTMGWVVMSLFGTLPFILSGYIPSFTDAFFETMSGYSTTGATILTDIEALPKGLLFWRSITHWIGGMGIIVLTIAILPLLGIGGMQLFVAESPGPSVDKLHPRITQTAKALWYVYVALTFAQTVILMFGGMSFFDAINHSMATLSTGGFSTKNASLGHWDSPFIQYVVAFFMFLGGTNFTMIYLGFKGKFSRLINNEEFKSYAITTLVVTFIVAFSIWHLTDQGFEYAFRNAIFQVISIITTTGFITADYTMWAPFITVLFFILLFTGGSAGSTSGGIKMMRHILLFKNSFLELKRQIHPSAILPVRFNGKAVDQNIAFNVSAFILIYLLIFFMGSLVMSLIGLDFDTALGAVAATLGNVGPGIGGVGPVDNYAAIPGAGKWVLAFFMLLGRLELFTVLILFSPYFWRKG
ncbi:MAG: trk system potassium uptake protein TrkH [Sphingobacteriales bacterium]|jgi:trk system potassium uptake protein TrkH